MNAIAENPESIHLPGMISGEQCRAARGLLGWSQTELADRADVGRSTVDKLERGGNPRGEYVDAIQRAIEAAGVYPIKEDRWGGQGVRFAKTEGQT